MENKGNSDELVLQEKPLFMWIVSGIMCFCAIIFLIYYFAGSNAWWKLIIMGGFFVESMFYLYIAKIEKLVLKSSSSETSYMTEIWFLGFRRTHHFQIGQITKVKLKESGRSNYCFYLDLYLVDGRCFSIFKSGLKARVQRKQIRIKSFVENYFAERSP
ncbi:unnamed protein product [Blepharisma stoltei]|uniref:Photosystem I assembly protein Ycf4 n=1 Tax=Blepharisma stoltei TaxID=1481888 RepID=A0AAU9J5N9_9CILI|nr:unnamed protein product [Blepharisma stoltei]